MSIGKLLIDDQPLQVLPALAEAIGLNEALILQQVHWLLLRSKKEFKGKSWVYNTYEEWQEKHFRFFSVSTIRRTISNLENLGLLISTTEFNQMKVDKTKWYTINYEALDRLAITTAKNDSPSVQTGQIHLFKMNRPITKRIHKRFLQEILKKLRKKIPHFWILNFTLKNSGLPVCERLAKNKH